MSYLFIYSYNWWNILFRFLPSLVVNLLIASSQAIFMLRGSILSSSLKYSTLNIYWKKFLVSAMISGVSRSNVCPTFSYLSTNDLTAAKQMDFLICDMLSKICFLGGSTTLFLALSLPCSFNCAFRSSSRQWVFFDFLQSVFKGIRSIWKLLIKIRHCLIDIS